MVSRSDPAAIAAFDLAALPEGFIDDPYPLLDALREQAPRHQMASGSLLLTRHADCVEVYRSPLASSDKREEFLPKYGRTPLYDHHTTSLVFNDPPLHTRVRRLLMGAVNQRAINRMQASLQTLIDDLLERLAERERVDIIGDFAAAIPIEVIGNLLAVPPAEREPLRDWSLAILGALEPVLDEEVARRGNRAVADFSEYLRGLIADRRRNPLDPEEDVLTRLIQGESGEGDDYRLSEFELIHQCIFLLNAGHETTTNLIGNGVWLLMSHPDQMRRLRDDPSLINPAVEEMLRFEGPIQLNNRRLTGELALDGETLKAGTLITICIGAANRDSREFDDPNRFDIGRRRNRHLAFGHGDHACVGMNVARLEGRLAIGGLLRRFAEIEPDGVPVRDMRVRFRGFTSLPARLR